jgi:hypothetical protein
MGIWKQMLTAHTALSAAFFSLHTAVGKGARNKFGICFQWRNEQLKPRMTIWTLRDIGNDAMNAQRWCTMMPDNQSSTQYFYHFSCLSHILSPLCVACILWGVGGLVCLIQNVSIVLPINLQTLFRCWQYRYKISWLQLFPNSRSKNK